ncbi:MAG: hypothetical protein ABSF33_00745 [Acidimicrobiales bacterium]|jgi:hypothetical protein
MNPPRRPKRSRDDLHALLIGTGRAILREEGLGTGAEALTFKRVFDRVERDTGLRLTNASVIRRVWANQADYQAEVLMAIALDAGGSEVDRTLDAVAPVFEGLDLSTDEARWAAMRELCRVAGGANIEALRTSPNWPSWIGVWALATAGDQPRRRRRIDAALLQGYESATDRFEQTYLLVSSHLGFRLRQSLTIRQFAIAVGALAEGCALRNRVDALNMEGIVRPTGSGGREQGWTLFAIGLEALVHQFLELDPDWSPVEDEG